MEPPTTTLMLGHAAELLAKVRLLEKHGFAEDDLRRDSKVFGHNIGNMWRNETPLFEEATAFWSSCEEAQMKSNRLAFDRAFSRLEEMHQRPFVSRYGGENRYPLAQPLLFSFYEIFEVMCEQHEHFNV